MDGSDRADLQPSASHRVAWRARILSLPGGTLETLASGGNDQLALGAALGLVVLYGVIATIVSLAVFRTRDITS
jgi:hypothetical protein